jgi:hypothetical protein
MFSFASPGHFFASLSHDIKVGVTFLQNHQAQIDSTLQVGANVVSALDPALAPLAQVIERAGEAALGEILAGVSKASDAEAAKGIDITLNQAVVQEFKNLLLCFEKIKPGSTVPPANLRAKVAV